MNTLGQQIRDKRLQRGISQEQLAQLLGCSLNTIYRWENSKFIPSIPLFYELSTIFQVSFVIDEENIQMVERHTNE